MKKTDEPTFEQALQQLESVVQRLEKGELPLEESLRLYEDGIRLSRGAAVMLAFGAGTLPALLGAGWLAGKGIALAPGPVARRIAGGALVVLAVAGILQAFGMADTALGAFCVPRTP